MTTIFGRSAFLVLLVLLGMPLLVAAQSQLINGSRVITGAFNYCAEASDDDTNVNTYRCALSPGIAGYRTGTRYTFKPFTTNTGAASLNLNGLGAKTIKKMAGAITTDLVANDIRAGQIVDVIYDGTNMQMLSQLGNAGAGSGDFSSNTATSVDSEVVLFSGTAGKTGKRATGTGLATLTSGVLGTVTAPTGVVVGTTDTQPLTNKSISGATNTITALPEGALTLTDITTNNASTSAHGFMQKYPGGTSTFLRADGAFATPAGGGNVSTSGTPVAGQLAQWVTSTTAKGVTQAVQVAGAATGGNGTGGSPWTGWESLFSGGGTANTGYYFAPGVYQFSSTITISANSVSWIGSGKLVTRLVYTGTSTAVLISSGTASTIDRFQMQGFNLQATDTANTKIMLDLRDISNSIFRDLDFGTGTEIVGGTGSIGIRTQGRELSTFTHITMRAEKPIVIADNPNSNIDIDHFHFSDLYLGSPGAYPIVTINDGIILSDVIFDGFQAWIGGTYGVYWNDTTSSAQSYFLMLKNIRWEQQSGTTGWGIWIDKASTVLRHLHIDNFSADTNTNGIHLNNVTQPVISNVTYAALAAGKTFLDSDGATILQHILQAGNASTTTYDAGLTEFLYAGTTTEPILSVVGPTSAALRLNPTTFKAPTGSSAPGTCTVGQLFYRTSDSKLVACTATNTWTIVGP